VWTRNITLGSSVGPMPAPLSPAGEFAFHLSTCPPTGKAKDANGVLKSSQPRAMQGSATWRNATFPERVLRTH
jgi:hypothetical protein